MSIKVKSLETDRAKIMWAIEGIAGEMGKIDAFVRHVSYDLDHSNITKETTINNFYQGSIGAPLLVSIRNNRVSVTTLINNAQPSNSEFNSLYESLKTLRSKYIDCYNIIDKPGDLRTFRERANTAISAYTSQLTSMNLNKFTTSAYTTANKNYVYASVLRSAQTAITNSANGFMNVQREVSKIGRLRYESDGKSGIGSAMSAYTTAVSNLGTLNAYRLMLLNVSNTYSGSISDVSAAYSSLLKCLDYLTQVPSISLDNFSTYMNIDSTNAKSNATKIGNAIAKAF